MIADSDRETLFLSCYLERPDKRICDFSAQRKHAHTTEDKIPYDIGDERARDSGEDEEFLIKTTN